MKAKFFLLFLALGLLTTHAQKKETHELTKEQLEQLKVYHKKNDHKIGKSISRPLPKEQLKQLELFYKKRNKASIPAKAIKKEYEEQLKLYLKAK